MKNQFLTVFAMTVLVLLLDRNAISQDVIKATFENGKSMDVTFWNNPDDLPKFELRFMGSVAAMPYQVSGFKIQPVYRINSDLYVDLGLFGSLVKGAFNITHEQIAKPNIDFLLAGHYSVFSTNHSKEKLVTVYSEAGMKKDVRNLYRIELPIAIKRSLLIDGGIGYFSSNSSFSDNISGVSYIGGGASSFGVQVGVSSQFSRSYKTSVENYSMAKYKVVRMYANLTLGLVNDYSIYELTTLSNDNFEYQDRTSEFSDLKSNPLGFRLGFDWSKKLTKSLGFIWGMEAGMTPFYRTSDVIHNGAIFLNVRLGLSYGGK